MLFFICGVHLYKVCTICSVCESRASCSHIKGMGVRKASFALSLIITHHINYFVFSLYSVKNDFSVVMRKISIPTFSLYIVLNESVM